MSQRPLTREAAQAALDEAGSLTGAGLLLHVHRSTVERALERGQKDTTRVCGDEADLTATDADLSDIPALLRSRKLDPDEWTVENVVVNEWDSPSGPMRQLKLHLRRKLSLQLIQPAAHVPGLLRPPRPKRDRSKARVFLVEGDHQAPYFDPALDKAATRMVAELQPDTHVFLGDTMDLPTISRFADHPAADASPQECIDAAYALLRRRAEAAPNAKRFKLKGNHDWRIEGEQLVRAERMAYVRPADNGEPQIPALSLRNLLHLGTLNIELVEDPRGWEHAEIEIVPGPHGLVVRHGWMTGANTAGRSLKKRGRSLIVGHGHGREHVFWWDPSAETERQAAMCGTMSLARSQRFPHFAPCDDWLQGLLTVSVFPNGAFLIEHARWHEGHLYWRDKRW